ncbi:hypothetical protein BDZ45DRAFT_696718 [Acephala macrosclerotiorum]|nr:hypothetical protein BDZ45DRAFT_696718 [Acephala macrosclerotiorum]
MDAKIEFTRVQLASMIGLLCYMQQQLPLRGAFEDNVQAEFDEIAHHLNCFFDEHGYNDPIMPKKGKAFEPILILAPLRDDSTLEKSLETLKMRPTSHYVKRWDKLTKERGIKDDQRHRIKKKSGRKRPGPRDKMTKRALASNLERSPFALEPNSSQATTRTGTTSGKAFHEREPTARTSVAGPQILLAIRPRLPPGSPANASNPMAMPDPATLTTKKIVRKEPSAGADTEEKGKGKEKG